MPNYSLTLAKVAGRGACARNEWLSPSAWLYEVVWRTHLRKDVWGNSIVIEEAAHVPFSLCIDYVLRGRPGMLGNKFAFELIVAHF